MTDLLAAFGPPAHRPLAVRLRQSRELAGLTQEQACASSGLSAAVLADLESGRRRPLPAHIDELSRAYGVNLAGLLVTRGPVAFDRATGRLAIEGRERHVAEPADAEDVYTAYLALLYAVRRAGPGQRVALRADDIDVLVSVVGEDADRIEQRLVALMGSTAQEASLVGRAVLRERAPDDDGARSTEPLSALARRIDTRTPTVAVVGLGYVGLPLLLAAARRGTRSSASTSRRRRSPSSAPAAATSPTSPTVSGGSSRTSSSPLTLRCSPTPTWCCSPSPRR